MKTLRPARAMRKTCLDCSGGSVKYVAYCPCDGLHSTRCELWPYRFGCRPENVHPRKYVTPEEMPGADVPLEDLPTPAITCRSGRKLTAEQREARLKALRMAQERRAALIKA